jgi:hypothetical protein
VAISETVLVLAGGTAVLSILFGMRVAMRVLAGGAAAPRSDGGQAAGETLLLAGFTANKKRLPASIVRAP